MALRFTSGIAGVPELTSAEAYVEFERNVRDGSYSWNPGKLLSLRSMGRTLVSDVTLIVGHYHSFK